MACEYAGGSIKQIVPVYSMECQQVKHMTVHIVRDNAMPAIQCMVSCSTYWLKACMCVAVIYVCTEDEAVQ